VNELARGPDEDAISQFAETFWKYKESTLFANRFLGVPTFQNPFDAWVIQEIIFEVKPEVVVETGTLAGGSALLWASILELATGDGRVITIDYVSEVDAARGHPLFQRRVDCVQGSSTDPAVIEEVAGRAEGKRALVILDSAHSQRHVAAELDAYAPLVSVGSYLIVQDGFLNGHPIEPDSGPGPYEAVQAFLARDNRFQVDEQRERMLFTFNPRGFLRRVA
jgi:cephalosporin hydroxylase